MKRFSVFIAVFLILWPGTSSYALDWKSLNEQAETLSLPEARDQVARNPDDREAAYVLGVVYLRDYMVQEAKDIFKRMAARWPDFMEAHWGLAEALKREHNYEDSIPVFEKIIKSHPDFGPAYVSLGYIKYIQRSFKEAIGLTGKAINLGKEKADTTTLVRAHGIYAATRGMMAHFGGPLSKAINATSVRRHLKIAKELNPDYPTVNFGYASYYMFIPAIIGRDLNKAQELLKETIEKEPLFPDAYARLAQIYRFKGNQEQYETFIDKALQLDPMNEMALDIKNKTCQYICLEEKR